MIYVSRVVNHWLLLLEQNNDKYTDENYTTCKKEMINRPCNN